MLRWLKRGVLVLAAAVFLFSVSAIGLKLYEDRQSEKAYTAAVQRFADGAVPKAGTADPTGTVQTESEAGAVQPPIEVDFDTLCAVNPDVIGWLYCEGTAINYPVLHGATNDTYLRHLYDGSYNTAGSLFIETQNAPDFSDANTVIYGHNMHNGTMFGGLSAWEEQTYYEQHPALWLLTPAQDYRVDILAAYYTSAYADVYRQPQDAAELEEYLAGAAQRSVISTQTAPEEGARYVLLSTCAYLFDDARFVVHGRLVPVDGAIWQDGR